MEANIRILSTNLTEALQSYIELRLHVSLGRFGRRVGRVRVRITDVNGFRGGWTRLAAFLRNSCRPGQRSFSGL